MCGPERVPRGQFLLLPPLLLAAASSVPAQAPGGDAALTSLSCGGGRCPLLGPGPVLQSQAVRLTRGAPSMSSSELLSFPMRPFTRSLHMCHPWEPHSTVWRACGSHCAPSHRRGSGPVHVTWGPRAPGRGRARKVQGGPGRAGMEDGAQPAFGGAWCCEQKLRGLIGLGSATNTTA